MAGHVGLHVKRQVVHPERLAFELRVDLRQFDALGLRIEQQSALERQARINSRMRCIDPNTRRHGRGQPVGEPAHRQIHVVQTAALKHKLVIPLQRRARQAQSFDVDALRRNRRQVAYQVVDVRAAVLEAHDLGAQPVHLRPVDLHLPAQQRQPCNRDPGAVDCCKFARAAMLAQRGLARREAQFGKPAQLEFTVEDQLPLGAFLHVANDLRLELIRIERVHRDGDQSAQQERDDQQPGDRVTVVGLGQRLGVGNLERTEARDHQSDDADQAEQCEFDCVHEVRRVPAGPPRSRQPGGKGGSSVDSRCNHPRRSPRVRTLRAEFTLGVTWAGGLRRFAAAPGAVCVWRRYRCALLYRAPAPPSRLSQRASRAGACR